MYNSWIRMTYFEVGEKDVMQLPLQTCTCDIKNIFRGNFIKKKPFDNIFKTFL